MPQPEQVDQLFSLQGSLALQVVLLLGIVSLGGVIAYMYRSAAKQNTTQYDALMRHHDTFAAEVRQERAQWHGTMVTVVQENTSSNTRLASSVNDLKDAIRQMTMSKS